MKAFALSVLLVSSMSFAHDEGHGPKVIESAKRGGVLASVVNTKTKKMAYKAELVRTGELARVYVYDNELKSVDLAALGKTAKGQLESKRKKSAKQSFELKLAKGVFEGNLPKAKSKPFDVEVVFNGKGGAYQAVFKNLD